MADAFNVWRRILIAIGFIFLLNGLVVGGLNLALRAREMHRSGSMPSMTVAIGFQILGGVGLAAAYFGLRSRKAWAWLAIAAAYLPWTVRGLLSDIHQGLWLLVVGELFGLLLVVLALGFTAGAVFRREGPSTPPSENGM